MAAFFLFGKRTEAHNKTERSFFQPPRRITDVIDVVKRLNRVPIRIGIEAAKTD